MVKRLIVVLVTSALLSPVAAMAFPAPKVVDSVYVLPHEVLPGEDLGDIARSHGLADWRPIYDVSPELETPDVVSPGKVVWVPAPGQLVVPREIPTPELPDVAELPAPPPVTVKARVRIRLPLGLGGVWDRLAQCESSGEWESSVGTFDGGLQFLPSTWRAYGGVKYAPTASQATREEQITIAERVLAGQGWGAWPACARELGLR